MCTVTLPQTIFFYEEECEECKDFTTHRADSFGYTKDTHEFSCRLLCTDCEKRAISLSMKFSVLYVTFSKEEWINFLQYFHVIQVEN